jgi:hypothetical protein
MTNYLGSLSAQLCGVILKWTKQRKRRLKEHDEGMERKEGGKGGERRNTAVAIH